MNEFDFKSWYVLLAIFIAHIYRHYTILEIIPKESETLGDAIEAASSGQGNIGGIQKQLKKVKSSLINFDNIILHFLAMLVFVTIILLLFNIPQNFLDTDEFGPLALPFNTGEKIIYLLIAFLFLLSYITKAIIPSIKAIKNIYNAKKKVRDLNKNE